jgi:hypothetical protein
VAFVRTPNPGDVPFRAPTGEQSRGLVV